MTDMSIFNILVALAGCLGAWMLNVIWGEIKELKGHIGSLPNTYVHKDDYREALSDIKASLRDILSELRNKKDKNDG